MTNGQDYGSYPAVGEAPITTGYVEGGYPPGGYVPPVAPPVPYDLTPPAEPKQPSTTDVAKDQASQVAGSAGDAAQHVAGVAKDQASAVAGSAGDAAQHVAGVAKDQVGQVTAEAGRQLKDLVGQAQSELSDQAQVQQQKLAGGLHSVGDQLKSMAEGSDQPGMATDLAHQGADRAHQIASWLEARDPGSVLDEVRSFARQRPGTFLAVALGAGIVAGRLARGMAADPDEAAPEAGGVR